MRQIGWFAKYFYDLRDKEAAEKISKFLNARECFTLRGVGLRFIKVLNLLIESASNTSLKNLGTQNIFKSFAICELVRAVAVPTYDVRFLQYYYQLKAVLCRRYGIQRTLCGYPAHGQRR